MGDTLTGDEVLEAGLTDWRMLLGAIHARYTTKDFATALIFVERIGAIADELDHHPDLDLRWGLVNIKSFSHDVGGVTQRDLRLAARIEEVARELGATPKPGAVQTIELALDTADWSLVRPFWKALLAGADNPKLPDEVRDPKGALPTLWFQETEPHETPKQRFHLDVHVPPDEAESRIRAALDAGGTLVSDEAAPSFWVLADPDGNRACICTWQGRGG
jgi:4a-hydroxytetrahydrobiopterin dehydratase